MLIFCCKSCRFLQIFFPVWRLSHVEAESQDADEGWWLAVIQDLRLLDREYFRFMYRLVTRKREEPFSPPFSMRRTEPAVGPLPLPGCPPSPDQPASRRDAGADEAAENLVEFAALFLLRVDPQIQCRALALTLDCAK